MNRAIIKVAALLLALSLTAGCGGKKKEREAASRPAGSTASQPQAPDQSSRPEAAGSSGQEEDEDLFVFPGFTTKDLNDNTVNQDLFKNADLTLVNIWGTFCGYCLEEMPELQELSQEYADKDVQIVGLVVDVYGLDGKLSEDQVKLAREIAEKTGTTYVHLLPSEDNVLKALSQTSSLPTSFFVNRQGFMVGDYILGARDKDTWKALIDETLEAQKNK